MSCSFLRIPRDTDTELVDYITQKYSQVSGTEIIYGEKKYIVYSCFLGNEEIYIEKDPILKSILKLQRFYLKFIKNKLYNLKNTNKQTILFMKNKIEYQTKLIEYLFERLNICEKMKMKQENEKYENV